MELKLRIIIIGASILTLMAIINMVKRENLDLKYVISWILTNIIVILMGICPEIIELISNIMGIGLPVNALFFMGILFILVIVYSLTVAQSRNSRKLKELTQKIALFEYEQEHKNRE